MSGTTEIVRASYSARLALIGELRAIDEAAEGRAYTDSESVIVTDKRAELETLDNKILANLDEQIRSEKMADSVGSMLHLLADRESGDLSDSRSVGKQFVDSDEFRNFASGGSLPRHEFTGMSFRAVTDTTLGVGSGGALARPPLQGRIGMSFLDRKVYLLDLLPHIATTDTAVVYVQDSTPLADMANKPAAVAESGAKPQAGLTLALVTEPISVIAAYVQMTRQVAADVPMVADYLDNRLRYALRRQADLQVLSGSGVAPIINGISSRSGITTYAPGAAEARALSIRHAITLMELNEAVPEIIVLNPSDAELFDITNFATAGLHSVEALDENPGDWPTKSAWGMTQVRSTAITAGTALLIDPMSLTVFDRQAPTAYLTDSHASNFTNNILTLLLEERLGLALFNPAGVCKVTFNGTT